MKCTTKGTIGRLAELTAQPSEDLVVGNWCHFSPVDLAESGCNGQATRYSTSTVVNNGAIAIEAQNILAGNVDGKVLGMRPYCSGVACDTLGAYAPITQWRCDAAGSPTTIAAAYLPAPCR